MTSTRTEPDPPVTARRRRRWPWILGAVLLVIALVATPFVYSYRRQIWSYATHGKGSPTHTVAYRHLPTPDLHMAVAGDIGDSGIRLDAQRDGRWHASSASRHTRPSSSSATTPTRTANPAAPGNGLPAVRGGPRSRRTARDPGEPRREEGARQGADTHPGDARAMVVAHDRRHAPRRTRLQRRIDNPEQRRFLERTLARSDARWKVVALHHPPYSAGYQGSSTRLVAYSRPLFECYGVQLVLSGHDHDYQRSKRIRGVTYLVSGAAAGTRRTGEGVVHCGVVLLASLRRSRVLPRSDRGPCGQPERSSRRHLRAPKPGATRTASKSGALLISKFGFSWGRTPVPQAARAKGRP